MTSRMMDGISVAEVTVKVRKKSNPRFSDMRMRPSKITATAMKAITSMATILRSDGVRSRAQMLSSFSLVVMATSCW